MSAPITEVDLRARASAIVADVAGRLADPAAVAAFHGETFGTLSLADGYPALALLYAELGHADRAHRRTAHAHLTAAADGVAAAAEPPASLFYGLTSLAFAASRAAHRPGEYAGLLTPLDERIAAGVTATLAPEFDRIEAGRAGTSFGSYDVIGGAAGVGRYLLDRCGSGPRPGVASGGPAHRALTEVLTYLTALSRPVGDLPGWWVNHAADGSAGEHANAGLAHGVPGPLALLALAWQAGERVPGQDEAIDRYAGWLMEWSDHDDHGRYWPDVLLRADVRHRPVRLHRARAAWCYGTFGVARALQLAGAATGRPAWSATAVAAAETAAETVLAHPDGHGQPTDAGLCHGWGGLLQVTSRIAGTAGAAGAAGTAGAAGGSPRLAAAVTGLAGHVVRCYDADLPFGFQAGDPVTGEPTDMSGFLEGAAGTALALHAFATGGPPASGWDAALLVT